MIEVDWLIVVLAFGACLAMTPLARVYSRSRGLIDKPGPRRSHTRPVARGGGVAIATAWLLCIVLVQTVTPAHAALAAGVIGFTLVGWLDDHRPLPVLLRLVPELVLAGALLSLIWPDEWGALVFAATVVVVTGWVNLFNFMDGSDGLATSHAGFAAVALGLAFALSGEASWATLALALAAASAAFLVWNRPPAQIFLGDAGSLMLGWSLAFLGLVALLEDVATPSFCLILAAPFLVDALLTLALRVVRGQQWYTPHRDHAYQILIRCGWSHRQVLVGLVALDFFLVAPVAGLALTRPELGSVLAALILMILAGVWSSVQFRLAGGHLTE